MKSSESLLIDISQLKINDNNLPEPKYSDDYYKENVNIINMESPVSLQIDISQLSDHNRRR
ncbi:hypothetical protein GLOIN_2v1875904 [Rhizophagus irregularis DAOM 181602=DAOM 197198]|uniref:Uncharacterized protein n=2 Tax=Rhizophagus irregularis TaxID=588596 RepID=A0A2P4Q1H4_RHIID|nr:hypothetical protein GLOIN_2v1875904 [Rhizophagus irregularis DAOM 181602=DAOM 197198]POG71483.1 hypothetical protein GLOIN_2v1875904 [Rhizophagus irregularis DAOM 181602=DAOM 197198]|eukprot:XP_025178349.1 hypothetical protein GLOIN_2v1875904 [Rhizophagus irregularis DAOM 181602=DAOM 197198]